MFTKSSGSPIDHAARRRFTKPGWGVRVVPVLVAMALGAASCTPITEVHGVEPDRVVVEAFQLGQTNEVDVQNAFGSPLTDGTFRPDIWYYTFQRTEALGFFKPSVVYRRIYAFDFDDQGLLENIATLTEADGGEVDFQSRITPTRGTESNFFQELFGNIGRFVGDNDLIPGGGPPGRPGGP